MTENPSLEWELLQRDNNIKGYFLNKTNLGIGTCILTRKEENLTGKLKSTQFSSHQGLNRSPAFAACLGLQWEEELGNDDDSTTAGQTMYSLAGCRLCRPADTRQAPQAKTNGTYEIYNQTSRLLLWLFLDFKSAAEGEKQNLQFWAVGKKVSFKPFSSPQPFPKLLQNKFNLDLGPLASLPSSSSCFWIFIAYTLINSIILIIKLCIKFNYQNT